MKEVEVMRECDIAPGAMKGLKLGNVNVLVGRDEQGAWFALKDCCSHAEVKLSGGKLCGHELECPAHGAKFDVMSGKVLCMPAVSGVKRYEVKIVDGHVFVVMP